MVGLRVESATIMTERLPGARSERRSSQKPPETTTLVPLPEPEVNVVPDRPIFPQAVLENITRGSIEELAVSAEAKPATLQGWEEKFDQNEAIEMLLEAFSHVNQQVVGREALLEQTLYALMTREHQLIFSKPGVAKSLFAMSVFSLFKDAKSFSIQLTKGTPEEALVGSLDINDLKAGKYRHNTDNSIVHAEFAFLDEIFDGNDVALRSLLGILNERVFRKGAQVEPASLHTAIATTNFLKESDVTQAVVDRFAYRANLYPQYDQYGLLRIDEAFGRHAGTVVDFEESKKVPFRYIHHLADIVEGRALEKTIKIKPHMLFLKNAIIVEYMNLLDSKARPEYKPFYISPRTIAKTREALNASALLRGRTEVQTEDLRAMRFMLCTIGDADGQERAFNEAYKKIVDGISERDLEIVDVLMGTHELFDQALKKAAKNEQPDLNLKEKLLKFFKIKNLGDFKYGVVEKMIDKQKPSHQLVVQLKDGFKARVEAEKQHLDENDPIRF